MYPATKTARQAVTVNTSMGVNQTARDPEVFSENA
jgi:hypothetical protein